MVSRKYALEILRLKIEFGPALLKATPSMSAVLLHV